MNENDFNNNIADQNNINIMNNPVNPQNNDTPVNNPVNMQNGMNTMSNPINLQSNFTPVDNPVNMQNGTNITNITSNPQNNFNMTNTQVSMQNNVNYQTNVPSGAKFINEPKKENNGKKKSMIIIFAIIGIIIVVILILIFSNKSDNSKYNEEVFDPETPILVYKDGKYGYIDTKGEFLIEPQYDLAYPFHGDFASVRINSDLYRNQIINTKGEILLDGYYVEFDEMCGNWLTGDTLYNSKMEPIVSYDSIDKEFGTYYYVYEDELNNETGIIDCNGVKKFTLPVINDGDTVVDYDSSCLTPDDCYEVFAYGTSKEDGKQIIVSINSGKIIYTNDDLVTKKIDSAKYGLFVIEYSDYDMNDDYIFLGDGKVLYESTGGILADCYVYDSYNLILSLKYDDYVSLGKSSSVEYYDAKNGTYLSSYDIDEELMNGYLKYSENGKKGLKKGEDIVLAPNYDIIKSLADDVFNYIKKSTGKEIVITYNYSDGIFNVLDIKSGEILKKIEDLNVLYGGYGAFLVSSKYDFDTYTYNYEIYNIITGKSIEIVSPNQLEYDIYSNYMTFEKEGVLEYYNADLEKIFEEDIE